MIGMEECKYRKMICNAGHETRPYSEGEILPKRCPVCNQPYDRRYNRPIFVTKTELYQKKMRMWMMRKRTPMI